MLYADGVKEHRVAHRPTTVAYFARQAIALTLELSATCANSITSGTERQTIPTERTRTSLANRYITSAATFRTFTSFTSTNAARYTLVAARSAFTRELVAKPASQNTSLAFTRTLIALITVTYFNTRRTFTIILITTVASQNTRRAHTTALETISPVRAVVFNTANYRMLYANGVKEYRVAHRPSTIAYFTSGTHTFKFFTRSTRDWTRTAFFFTRLIRAVFTLTSSANRFVAVTGTLIAFFTFTVVNITRLALKAASFSVAVAGVLVTTITNEFT